MCYPKPGPRCASHALDSLRKAVAEVKKFKELSELEPADQSHAISLDKAKEAHLRAQLDYYGTPKGQQEILRLASRAKDEGKHSQAEALHALWSRAVEKRTVKLELASIARGYSLQHKTSSTEEPIRGKRMVILNHAVTQAKAKGIDPETIVEAFKNPERVYPNNSAKYPGQYRVVGAGVCLVGRPSNDGTFKVVTMYLDDVETPVRKDQLAGADGRSYQKNGRQNRHVSARHGR